MGCIILKAVITCVELYSITFVTKCHRVSSPTRVSPNHIPCHQPKTDKILKINSKQFRAMFQPQDYNYMQQGSGQYGMTPQGQTYSYQTHNQQVLKG